MSIAKTIALTLIAWSGYVLLKQTDFTSLLQRHAELNQRYAELDRDLRLARADCLQKLQDLQKLQEKNRDMRIVLDANARELERARAQAWEAFDKIGRLKIPLE
jgi:hypothetical protein